MTFTERDISVVRVVAENYTLTASQIRRLCFPGKDMSVVRRRLAGLWREKLVNRTTSEVVVPAFGLTCPVYYPSRLGVEHLAAVTGDDRYLLVSCQTPSWQNLAHFVGLSDLRITIHQAVQLHAGVALSHFFNEFDVVNKDERDPDKRYRLYTQLRVQPKLVCVPDAAFALASGGYCKAFYVELHRRDSVQKAAAEKTPGYAVLAANKLHRRHFPEAMDEFSVLVFAPTSGVRDLLRREFAKKESPDLYWFAAMSEVKPDTFFAPIFYSCKSGPFALLKGENA